MLRLKHLGRLTAEVASYARVHGAWWIIPVMLILAVVTVVSVTTQAAVPYAVYTLF